MNEKITIFDILKNITYQKDIDLSEHPLFQKTYDVFMINRWLSMHPSTLLYANYLSQKDFSKLAHYKFLFNELPKKFIKFNYQKQEKGNEDLKSISNYYKISLEKAKEIVELLDENYINKIKEEVKYL